MSGTAYLCKKIFCCERSYRIQQPVNDILGACETEPPSEEARIIKHFKMREEAPNLITLVWKTKSIEPIVHIRREGDFLILTYNFTHMSLFTCGVVLMFLISLFSKNWQSALNGPNLLFYAVILLFWTRAIKVAKAVDAYFKRHEKSYDDLCSLIQ